MVDDDDTIVLLDGVKVEDKSNMPVFELGNDVLTKEQLGEVLGQDSPGEAQEDMETPGDDVATGFQFDSLDDVLKDLETGEQAEEAPAEEVYEGQEIKEAQGDVQGTEGDQEGQGEPEGDQEGQEPVTEEQEEQQNEEVQEGQEDNSKQEQNGNKGNRNKSHRKK